MSDFENFETLNQNARVEAACSAKTVRPRMRCRFGQRGVFSDWTYDTIVLAWLWMLGAVIVVGGIAPTLGVGLQIAFGIDAVPAMGALAFSISA